MPILQSPKSNRPYIVILHFNLYENVLRMKIQSILCSDYFDFMSTDQRNMEYHGVNIYKFVFLYTHIPTPNYTYTKTNKNTCTNLQSNNISTK